MGSTDEEGAKGGLPLVLDVDVLVVGAGPSGASLSCFLASYGVNALMISDVSAPMTHPRANYFNMAGLECLREIGLEEKALEIGFPVSEYSPYTRFCNTLAGEEIYRAYAHGSDPHRHGEYHDASPSGILCLCQTKLEHLLLGYAADHGVPTRWNTRLLTFAEDRKSDTVLAVLENTLTQQRSMVRCKYLAAADGANSSILPMLDIPVVVEASSGSVTSVHVEADLGHLASPTPALLNYLGCLDAPQPLYGPIGIAHFIEPWKTWSLSLFPHPSCTQEPTDEMVMTRIKELIGDDSVHYEVKGIKTWALKNIYAEKYSQGKVYCVGNAVHQHPPFGGLGTSTCLEDAFNLAWKFAHVLQGKAGKSLLDSYSNERQPAGKYVVGRTALNGILNFKVFGMMGYLDGETTMDRRARMSDLLKEDSPEGESLRCEFRKAVQDLGDERHNVGAVMNQWYKSDAVYSQDELEEPPWPKTESERSCKVYTSTYPGWRVPHAWLSVSQKERGGRKPLVSTRDLVGHGKFVILTGIGGKNLWAPEAKKAGLALGVDIEVLGIGWGQDYEDTFFRWSEVRQVSERGAVLVRPDRTVAWRAQGSPADAPSTLEDVLRSVLCL
ncbi:related to phenol 2-monooxygenase [Ramularia collo-cygni]|uniref:Related to phenol 2-monooxygenase n=1 Tax=Ramularia collo-cygni TaxID=112498 RepID=A0A2D3US86_9PEZI|nr:related to phenol 2-monooxygenase [Ramularia collo-cygni]CZT15470.1 related to phenol 2-monooxygenase [Ramularia collo-cygni]